MSDSVLIDPKNNPELVICIHGTGAQQPGVDTPKWWESRSDFASRLAGQLADLATVDAPFVWSGLNWESKRREAATLLLGRLSKLDEEGRKYHIIGHSHGGSIIWLALVDSARNGRRLTGLRTWTTVGTPFIYFAPNSVNWPAFLLTVVVTAAVSVSLISFLPPVAELAYIFRVASWAESLKVLLPTSLTVLAAVAGIIAAAGQVLRKVLDRRNRRSRVTAAQWYFERWYGIWHDQDEPIAGLATTLDKPFRIASRGKSSWFILLNWFRRLIDVFVADAPDDFAWRLLTRRLQGNDLVGYSASAVSRAPLEFGNVSSNLPAFLAERILAVANQKASEALVKVRSNISMAYDSRSARTIMLSTDGAITWAELIHTSYLDQPELCDLMSKRIRREQGSAGGSFVPRKNLPYPGGPAWQPWKLRSVIAAALAIPLLLLCISIRFYGETGIYPYSEEYQINAVIEQLSDQGKINIGANQWLGVSLAKLMLLGKLQAPEKILGKLSPTDGQFEATQPISYAYGFTGRSKELYTLLPKLKAANDPANNLALKIIAAHAVTDAAKPLEESDIAELVRLTRSTKFPDPLEYPMNIQLATVLFRSGKAIDATEILSKIWANDPSKPCAGGGDLDPGLFSLPNAVDVIFKFCQSSKPWKGDKYAAIKFLLENKRKEDARRAWAALKVAKPRDLSAIADHITFLWAFENRSDIRAAVRKSLVPQKINDVGVLSKRCGVLYDAGVKIYTPIELHVTEDQANSLGILDYALQDLAKEDQEAKSFLKEIDAELSTYLRTCVSFPLSAIQEDVANLIRAKMLASRSQELAEIVHQRAMAVGRELGKAGKWADAADVLLESTTNELLSHESIREGLLQARDMLKKIDPLGEDSKRRVMTFTGLAREAWSKDEKELTIQFQRDALDSMSQETDVMTRAAFQADLARFLAGFGLTREARLAAEAAGYPNYVLNGYMFVIDSYASHSPERAALVENISGANIICLNSCSDSRAPN